MNKGSWPLWNLSAHILSTTTCVFLLLLHIYSLYRFCMELALTFLWTLNFRHNSHMCFFKAALWIIHVPFTWCPWERWAPVPCLLHLLCSTYFRHTSSPFLPPHRTPQSHFLYHKVPRSPGFLSSFRSSGKSSAGATLEPAPPPPPPSRKSDVKVKDREHGARLAPPLSLSRAHAPYALLLPVS